MPDSHPAAHNHHVARLSTLVWTLIALIALTALTVYTAKYVHLGGSGNLWAAIAISILKSSLVASLFMGLLWDKGLNRVVLFFCLIGVAMFLGFTLIDMASRGDIHNEVAMPFQNPTIVYDAKMSNPAVADGRALFEGTCASCHGMDARGLPGLGKDMTTSEFIASTDDKNLLRFVKRGRLPSDPMNTTNVAMPPRGGNPTLNDKKLKKIIAFIRVIRPYTGKEGEKASSSH